MRGWVYSYLNTESTSNQLFTETNVDYALNRAQEAWVRSIARHTGYFRTGDTVDATAADIDAPDDFFGDLQVRFNNGTDDRQYLIAITRERLLEINPNYADATTTGTPTHYILNLNTDGTTTISLYPTLTATVTNGITFFYTVLPTELADDADESVVMTWFPEQAMLALPAYALITLYGFEAGTRDDQIAKWDNIWKAQLERGYATAKQLVWNAPSWKRR